MKNDLRGNLARIVINLLLNEEIIDRKIYK